MKSKKQNIANNLIKNPVDLRSQRSRAKGQGQSLNSSLGAPLAAGYFSNGRSNRDVNPIDTGGASQIDIPGEGFTDEAYQPPNFNPCPPGYTQNPGATGDYDDPYCIPSTNMPGGESFIPGVGDSLGMAFEGAFGNSIPAGDPFAGGPEDQPGFGEGAWCPSQPGGYDEDGNVQYTINMMYEPVSGTCVPAGDPVNTMPGFEQYADLYTGMTIDPSTGELVLGWDANDPNNPNPQLGTPEGTWTGGDIGSEFGMNIDPNNPAFDFDTSEIEAFASWSENFGTNVNGGAEGLDPNNPETWCHYQGMSMGADGECTGDFYTPDNTPDDWDEDYCWNGTGGCDCTYINYDTFSGGVGFQISCGHELCEGSDCA
mgnify:FL=1